MTMFSYRLQTSFRSTQFVRYRLFTTTHSTGNFFPWRSTPVVLERLTTGDDLSGQRQRALDRFVRAAVAARELQIGWGTIFFGNWKDDLARDLGWAFQKGLSGLLSNAFKGKI